MCHCLYPAYINVYRGCSLSSPGEPVGEATQRANMALSTFTDGLAWCIRSYHHIFVHVQFVLVHALSVRTPPCNAFMHDRGRAHAACCMLHAACCMLHAWSSPCRYTVWTVPCIHLQWRLGCTMPAPPGRPPAPVHLGMSTPWGSCHVYVATEIGAL